MGAVDQVVAEIQGGDVSFPTNSDVAFRVRLALDDPELHIAKAAQIIQAEPLLATRVVALANSVAFNRDAHHVADVRSGIARIGLKFVRALATAVVMRQMAGSVHSEAFKSLAVRLWEHTVHVAAIAHLLAGRFGSTTPDTALFAGIVHEVGGFYLISRADALQDALANGTLLSIEAEATIGRAVLAALAVPGDVAAAIESLWRAGRIPVYPPRTLGDILRLANALTPIQSPMEPIGGGMAGVPLDPPAQAQLAEILDQSGDELAALTAALRY